MLGSNRQSILQRPIKKSTQFNRENRDVEYQKEQQLLQAKRNRYNAVVDHRRRAIDGSKDEKKELQDATRREIDEHLQVRRQLQQQQQEEDSKIIGYQKNQQQDHFGDEYQQRMQKKEYLKSIMEENKKLVEYRRQLQQKERNQDKNAEDDEVEFFDRYRSYR